MLAIKVLPLERGDLEHRVSGRPDTDPLNIHTHELFDPPDVVPGVDGKVFELAHLADVLLPTWQSLVDHLDGCEGVEVSWHAVQDLAVNAVVNSNLDLLEGVQDVELGEVDPAQFVGGKSNIEDKTGKKQTQVSYEV